MTVEVLSVEDREAHDAIIEDAWRTMMAKCPPRHCPPKPTNQTRLLAVMAAADLMAMELLPHQICIAATLTEALSDDNVAGPVKYREALIMFSRQSGKSAVLQALIAERILAARFQRWAWAAQRLEAAILQIEQKTWPTIKRLGLASHTAAPNSYRVINVGLNAASTSASSTEYNSSRINPS